MEVSARGAQTRGGRCILASEELEERCSWLIIEETWCPVPLLFTLLAAVIHPYRISSKRRSRQS